MKDVIRFGILSFAHYHAHFWAQAITQSPEATLIGIWDDDPQRGSEAAQQYRTRYWPDLPSLLRECHAVGITSETVKHAPLVEEAAAAGVHILCEKPMATTLEDCQRIERAVRQAGVIYMQNFPKRFDPINQELVDLVRDGSLGSIALVRVRHGHGHGLEEAFRHQWFVNPALSGGGTLIDEGIHVADFLLWLLGEPEKVSAVLSHRTLGLPVEDTALAIFIYPTGTIAEMATGWTFVAAEQSVEVYGTVGTALLSGVDLASRDVAQAPYLKVFRRDRSPERWEGSSTIPLFTRGTLHQQGPMHFIHILRTGGRPPVGLEEGRKALEMILAAYQAAKNGATQAITFSWSAP
jgi:predicted dehydrogenase